MISVGSGNNITYEIQVGAAITGSPADKNNAGIVSFDDSSFDVDSNGYVTLLASGNGIMTNTGDDSVSVSPDGAGNFNWLGVAVANATHAKPIYFKDSATANAIDLDVQVGAAVTGAPGDKNDAGIVSFNDLQFSVDGDGYVQMVGGSDLPAVQTLTSDDPTTVGPDASGDIDITGETVANATNAKPVFVDAGTNALNIEVQVAAAITGAPSDKLDAGLCSFDDSDFTVDSNGYVSLLGTGAGETITGDSGGALSPTGGNWNILGRSGSKTSGSGSTLTVNSPPYADQGSTTTVTLNSGSFSTAAITLTLPATAGIADGDLCEFIAATTDALVITANTGQTIRIGTLVSSSGGTATSTKQGDSVSLRWSATAGSWFATSCIGTWVMA